MVKIRHLIQPAGTEGRRWRAQIEPLIVPDRTEQQYQEPREAQFLAGKYSKVDNPGAPYRQAGPAGRDCSAGRYLYYCSNHQVPLCPQHQEEHDRAIHQRRSCGHYGSSEK